jgi:hypothetical protein
MKFSALAILLLFPLALSAAERPKVQKGPPQNRLFCKTGPEKRAAGQPLKLYLNYNLPFVFEAEDPTVPFGRQMLLLAGRPTVQLFFEKAGSSAGDSGENLQPMQCAFARRVVRSNEPGQVQILLPPNQLNWISQSLGQRAGAMEKAVLTPGGDWSFAYQFEQVFYVDIEEPKGFITTQLPRQL